MAGPDDRRPADEPDSFFRRSVRQIGYRLLRPRPLTHPGGFSGPVLVLGSAPQPVIPDGYDDSFSLITINGSQTVAENWGLGAPDATFLQFSQVNGSSAKAREVRKLLTGKRTGILWVVRWRDGRRRLVEGIRAFNYGYDELGIVPRGRRIALQEAVMGEVNFESSKETKQSNGIMAICYALASGAPAVVISGINPTADGHSYNAEGLKRRHAGSDLAALRRLQALGKPVYTADAHVSEATGLPLWKYGAQRD